MPRKRRNASRSSQPTAAVRAPGGITRRALLRGAGLLGLGVSLGGWVDIADAARIRPPGSRPFPNLPEGTDTLPEIEHVVIVMMENHSFDNYFGALERRSGSPMTPHAANPDGEGNLIHAFRMPSTCQLNGHPGQNWNASHISFANGRNDGFVLASGPVAMGYWTEDDLPFYYGLARTFPLARRWFGSTLCQTYPNRRFLMAGTAAGIISTSTDSLLAPGPPNGNIFDRLDAHGIGWLNYYSDLPSIGILLQYASQHQDKLIPIARFFTDAAAGALPAVSLVDPLYLSAGSEENPDDIRLGEEFVSRVVNAVMSGPGWPKTLLVWLYDEHGGYYDHVPPPRAIPPDDIPPNLGPDDIPDGYDRYSFRVPAVIVSPYARPNHVSHRVRDHTSVLKFIERKWNLGALTFRDANADDLFDCLDFLHPPAFLDPPTLPAPALDRADPPPCTPGDPGIIPPPEAVRPALGALHTRLRARARPPETDVPMGVPLAEAWGELGIGPLATKRGDEIPSPALRGRGLG
jgi:phospholipase C